MMNALPLIKVFAAANCKPGFFGIPTWYEYLHLDKNCQVIFNSAPRGGAPTATDFFGSFVLIALAVIDILLRIGGLVAVFYVVYGGIQYVTSQGEPDKTSKARGTIINALVGLVIAVISTGIVAFLGSKLGG